MYLQSSDAQFEKITISLSCAIFFLVVDRDERSLHFLYILKMGNLFSFIGNLSVGIFQSKSRILFYMTLPGEASSSPQRGPRVNAQMMTSLPSPFTLSSLPLIDRVCVAKACPGRDTNSLLRLCECWPGYWYRFRLVKVFSFLFLIFWFHCIVTFNCMLSCICMLTCENI